MTSILNYIFLGSFSFTSFLWHPTHISVTNIDVYPENKKMEIAVKAYTADIELALAYNYHTEVKLQNTADSINIRNYTDRYFNSNFAVVLNQKEAVKLLYKKNETIDEFTWFYFEVPISSKTKKILFKNAILFDQFFDQTNLMIIVNEGKETGTKFTFYEREFEYRTP